MTVAITLGTGFRAALPNFVAASVSIGGNVAIGEQLMAAQAIRRVMYFMSKV
jgi:hypothetical protein